MRRTRGARRVLIIPVPIIPIVFVATYSERRIREIPAP